MSRVVVYISVLVTLYCMLNCNVKAQQVACANATPMQNVNLTQVVGTWYEVARKPNVTNMGCIEVDFKILSDNKTLGINVTYLDPQANKWVNMTAAANITLDLNNNNGYNVSFVMGDKIQQTQTMKLLNTDYNNYAFICGYTNASDASTAFGTVLTRVRMPNASNISTYEEMASKNYTNFSNMSVIMQSAKCYRSSASTLLPRITTMLVAIYSLFNFIF